MVRASSFSIVSRVHAAVELPHLSVRHLWNEFVRLPGVRELQSVRLNTKMRRSFTQSLVFSAV